MAEINLVCPKCGKDDLMKKVSAIYKSGHANVSGYAAGGYSNTLSQSLISQQLAPPIAPVSLSVGCEIKFGIILFLSIAFGSSIVLVASLITNLGRLLSKIEANDLFWLSVFLIPIVIMLILTAVYYAKAKRIMHSNDDLPQRTEKWKLAIKRWEALYYCERDDVIFDQDECKVMPVGEMTTYIFR